MANTAMSADQLKIVRASLLGGVLIFGAVAWYITRSGGGLLEEPAIARLLPTVFAVLAVMSIGGMLLMRTMQASSTDPGRRGGLAIAGWALGEAPAMLGGVIWLLTGSPALYFAGTILLIAAFAIVPVTEER